MLHSARRAFFVCILFLAGCGAAEDQFWMSLNGWPYPASHGEPKGYLVEYESGFNLDYRIRIVLPLAPSGGAPMPGLEIEFDPARIRTGKEISFNPESSILVSYYPAIGHRYDEGKLLAFGPGEQGSWTIIFDQVDVRDQGQVKGKLKDAVLYGYYMAMDGLDVTFPPEPMRLEIRNFIFDVKLEESWW